MAIAVPQKIILRNTTSMSLNDRFGKITKIVPTPQSVQVEMAADQQASAKNRRLAQQMANRQDVREELDVWPMASQQQQQFQQQQSQQSQQLQQPHLQQPFQMPQLQQLQPHRDLASRLGLAPSASVYSRLGAPAHSLDNGSVGGRRGGWARSGGVSAYRPLSYHYDARIYSGHFNSSAYRWRAGRIGRPRAYMPVYRGGYGGRGMNGAGYSRGRWSRWGYGGQGGRGAWQGSGYNNFNRGRQGYGYQRGGGGWGRGGRRGGGRGGNRVPVTKEQLDNQLDDYMANAKSDAFVDGWNPDS